MAEQQGEAFRLLLSRPGGVGPSQLRVDFSEAYGRQAHPDEALERKIRATWKQRLGVQADLYNGSKFRYGGWREEDGGCGVRLQLGLTDYMTFVGTNLSSEWERFVVAGAEGVEKWKHLASPLGNGAVVETSDGLILTLRRSSSVGEFPGHLVFPGGHSEPEEVGVCGYSQAGGSEEVEKAIAKEMFEGMVREVVEETGVPASSLQQPLLIGISQRLLNARPTAFFYIPCSLPAQQVLRLYAGAAHAFESTQLHAVTPQELHLTAHHMPGCHQGGLALFRLMRSEQQQERRVM